LPSWEVDGKDAAALALKRGPSLLRWATLDGASRLIADAAVDKASTLTETADSVVCHTIDTVVKILRH